MTTFIRSILVYVDGSEKSFHAAQAAVCLAKTFQAKLTAVYVVNLKVLDELLKAKIFVDTEEMDYERDIEHDGKKFLFGVEQLGDDKGVTVNSVLTRGAVVDEVLAAANRENADLVVIGELEEWPSRKDYFSDIERLSRQVKCPVFIAKDAGRIARAYEALE